MVQAIDMNILVLKDSFITTNIRHLNDYSFIILTIILLSWYLSGLPPLAGLALKVMSLPLGTVPVDGGDYTSHQPWQYMHI